MPEEQLEFNFKRELNETQHLFIVSLISLFQDGLSIKEAMTVVNGEISRGYYEQRKLEKRIKEMTK